MDERELLREYLINASEEDKNRLVEILATLCLEDSEDEEKLMIELAKIINKRIQ